MVISVLKMASPPIRLLTTNYTITLFLGQLKFSIVLTLCAFIVWFP